MHGDNPPPVRVMAPLYFKIWKTGGRWIPGEWPSAQAAAAVAIARAEKHPGTEYQIHAVLFLICAPRPIRSIDLARQAGGHKRAANLSPERRREIARQAARARWDS
jgi:hypothetical protein